MTPRLQTTGDGVMEQPSTSRILLPMSLYLLLLLTLLYFIIMYLSLFIIVIYDATYFFTYFNLYFITLSCIVAAMWLFRNQA